MHPLPWWRVAANRPPIEGSEIFGPEIIRTLGRVEAGLEDETEIGDGLDEWDARRAVARALLTLKPREERVLRMRYGVGCREHTLDEVGHAFDLTRERIRQIEGKAMRKLAKVAEGIV